MPHSALPFFFQPIQQPIIHGEIPTKNRMINFQIKPKTKLEADVIDIETKKTVGTVNADGNFRILGKTYKIHGKNSPISVQEENKSYRGHKFFDQFIKNLNIRAKKSVMTAWIRSSTEATGKGINIWMLEPNTEHAKQTTDVLLHPAYGIAKGANVSVVIPKTAQNQFVGSFDLQQKGAYEEYFDNYCTYIINQHTEYLKAAIKRISETCEKPDVINLSLGRSRVDSYRELATGQLDQLKNTFEIPLYKAILQKDNPDLLAFYNQIKDRNTTESIQAMVDFVDRIYEKSEKIPRAIQEFNAAAKQLNKMGILIVIANGNERNIFPTNVQLKPGAQFNMLAESPYVIPIAYSNTNGTPNILKDDYAGHHSSSGYSKADIKHHPFLTAPGECLPINRSELPNSGSSYSAPFVAGVVALMKEVNPSLSNERIIQILQSSCENVQKTDATLVGNGYLNPVKAIKMAESEAI